MNESEFNEQADAIFARIEAALDQCEADIDYDSNGVVMEIELPDSSKIILNRHVPNREIWIAAKSGGFHYSLQDGRWFSQRDSSELLPKLAELVLGATGEQLDF